MAIVTPVGVFASGIVSIAETGSSSQIPEN